MSQFEISAYNERFAKQLEAGEDSAWHSLTNMVWPVHGDPVADQVAALLEMRLEMRSQGLQGPPSSFGTDIRKMLHDKERQFDLPESAEEDWGTAGGPPLPGRRLIDGEWKSVPYAEWTDADKALAEDLYGDDSDAEEERLYEEWLAKRDQWLQKQSKETLIKMVLMDDLEKELYINKHIPDRDDSSE
jgi:hypothetical protein